MIGVMNSIPAHVADSPRYAAFLENLHAGIGEAADATLAGVLVAEDQGHLYEDWDRPGTRDAEKLAFLEALRLADRSYPGGIPAYVKNARVLLAGASAGENPFEGCTPHQPDLVDLSGFGPDYDRAEAAGISALPATAVVLVAGGLGERLGYGGIKLEIPVEVTETTPYLAHYAGVLREASRRIGRPVPLVIMTSRDTDEKTRTFLAANDNFGLADVTILRQELVPALADVDGRLAAGGRYALEMKPHGHGDIHMLLHSSGTAARLAAAGIRYLLFIQDTNAQAFNAAFAAIGVSELHGYDFNSIAVNRIPGEAVGGLARLVRDGAPDLTINVEYNQLDPLLRATVSPEGDVPDARGFSLFPGNINLLVIRLEPYLRVLEESRGIIAEFVNPKFADASRTSFKKPTRLETMMQDLPKLFHSGEKVGVTVFDRAWAFSACKNNLADAAAKAASGGPPESASSAESDFYAAGRTRLRHAGCIIDEAPAESILGVPVVPCPRVIVRPSFALTLADAAGRFSNVTLRGDCTLVLDGDIRMENVTLEPGAGLVLGVPPGSSLTVRDLTVSNDGFRLVPLDPASPSPEFLQIRGYRIAPVAPLVIRPPGPGRWIADANGLRQSP